MGQVEAVGISNFEGLHYNPHRFPSTSRRNPPTQLRWLENMYVDQEANLRLPRAARRLYDLADVVDGKSAEDLGDIQVIYGGGTRGTSFMQTEHNVIVNIRDPDNIQDNDDLGAFQVVRVFNELDEDLGELTPASAFLDVYDQDNETWDTWLGAYPLWCVNFYNAELFGRPVRAHPEDRFLTPVTYLGGPSRTYRLLWRDDLDSLVWITDDEGERIARVRGANGPQPNDQDGWEIVVTDNGDNFDVEVRDEGGSTVRTYTDLEDLEQWQDEIDSGHEIELEINGEREDMQPDRTTFTLDGFSEPEWRAYPLDIDFDENEDHDWFNFPHGRHATIFKSKLFLVTEDNQIRFSNDSQPERWDNQAGDQGFSLGVGGSQIGADSTQDPGRISALVPYQDYVVVLCTRSIWQMVETGDVYAFTFQRLPGDTGAYGHSALHVYSVPDGLAFVGGQGHAETGIYVFNGASTERVSDPVGGIFDQWGRSDERFLDIPLEGEDEPRWYHEWVEWGTVAPQAARFRDIYFLRSPFFHEPGLDVGEGIAFNTANNTWSTVDWRKDTLGAPVTVFGDYYKPDRWVIADGTVVYETLSALPRFHDPDRDVYSYDRPGRFRIGWWDEDNPTGMVRFLAVKVHGWSYGGGCLLHMTARVPNYAAVDDSSTAEVRSAVLLPLRTGPTHDDEFDASTTFETAAFGLDLRGEAIDLDFQLITSSMEGGEQDDPETEAVIESVEIVYSRKPEKVSRR